MAFDPIQEARAVTGEREFYVFDFGTEYGKEFYTTHSEQVTESDLTGVSVTWTPLPIVRKGVKKKHTVQPETTRLVLPVTNSFVSLVAQGGLDAIQLTIYRGFGDDYANDYRKPWWFGYLEDINVTAQIVSGNLKSVEVLFEDVFPKVFHQSGCNNTLFDSVCSVDPATVEITRNVTDIQGDGRIIVTDGAIPTNDTYTLGKMRKTGTATIWRHVTQQAGLQYVLHIPILGLSIGDQVDILPGCAKRIQEDCIDKFSNKPNNVSMPLSPKINPVIDGF